MGVNISINKNIEKNGNTENNNNQGKEKTIGIIITIMVVIAAILLAYFVGTKNGSEEISFTGIGGQLRTVSNIEGTNYDYTAVIRYVNPAKIINAEFSFFDDVYIYSLSGKIIAGVDVSNISDDNIVVEKDIDDKPTKVTINMPGVSVLYEDITDDSETPIYQYDGPMDDMTDDKKEDYKKALKAIAHNNAIEDGIVENTEKQCTKILTTIISSFEGYNDAEIVINYDESSITELDVDEDFENNIFYK